MNMKRVGFLVVAIKLLHVKTMYILIWIRYLWDSLYVSLSGDLSCTQVYQLLTHGRWFSPDTSASSTTKTGRHDIAEIFLKVALKHQK
jgi:hypothetical protein